MGSVEIIDGVVRHKDGSSVDVEFRDVARKLCKFF